MDRKYRGWERSICRTNKKGHGQQVDFTIFVEGTSDKLVEMTPVPPGAGVIKQPIDNPEVWTYTAPRTIPPINPVRIVAKSVADPVKLAKAEAFVLQG